MQQGNSRSCGGTMASRLAVQESHLTRRPDAIVARSRGELEGLAGIGISVAVEPGQTVVLEGDPIEHYYRIVSGTARLHRSIADGRRQVIDFPERARLLRAG